MAAVAGVLRVGRHEIEIARPEKVLFPEDGITKGDLIEYYARIAPRILPHLRDRPLTLERYPDGIHKQRIFQKEVSSYFPKWIRRVTVKKVGGTVTHLVCNDTATLVYIANQACVTPHIFLSRIDKLDIPDQMVFDLDPQQEDFEPVRSTARAFKKLLDDLELPAYLKTTGSRGLHVVVPLQRLTRRPELLNRRQVNLAAGHRVIISSVVEFLLDELAHLDPVFRCYGDIPTVEQRMDVLPQQ